MLSFVALIGEEMPTLVLELLALEVKYEIIKFSFSNQSQVKCFTGGQGIAVLLERV